MATTILSNLHVGLPSSSNADETLSVAGAMTVAEGTILGRITASGYLTPYASGNSDGSQVPVAVAAVASVFTGAGTARIRPIVAGPVVRELVCLQAGGTVSAAQFDLLRSMGINPVSVNDLNSTTNL